MNKPTVSSQFIKFNKEIVTVKIHFLCKELRLAMIMLESDSIHFLDRFEPD